MKHTHDETRRRALKLLEKLGWEPLALSCFGPAEIAIDEVIKAIKLAEKRGWRRGVEESQ